MTPHHITMLRSAGYYVAAALLTYGLHNFAPEYQGVALPIILALLSVLQVSLGYEAGKKLGVESFLLMKAQLGENAVSDTFLKEIQLMTPALQKLADQVRANGDLNQSLIALVHGFSDQVKQLKDDPAAIEELCNTLKTQASAMSAAVQANTPASGTTTTDGTVPATPSTPADPGAAATDAGAAPAAPAPTDGSTPTT